MTAPATLDDDQVERLSQLLDQRAVPFKGFNLEALDGFLSALVVTPDTVPPSERALVSNSSVPEVGASFAACANTQMLLTAMFVRLLR